MRKNEIHHQGVNRIVFTYNDVKFEVRIPVKNAVIRWNFAIEGIHLAQDSVCKQERVNLKDSDVGRNIEMFVKMAKYIEPPWCWMYAGLDIIGFLDSINR